MLYDHSQPDANLLEYSISQAARSLSSVMAGMLRRPRWSADERIKVICALRRCRMPLMCIDLCLAMAAEDRWDIQALGTEEWNLTEKICSQYSPCEKLIERHIQSLAATGSTASSRTSS